jgi:hypothetical protein
MQPWVLIKDSCYYFIIVVIVIIIIHESSMVMSQFHSCSSDRMFENTATAKPNSPDLQKIRHGDSESLA